MVHRVMQGLLPSSCRPRLIRGLVFPRHLQTIRGGMEVVRTYIFYPRPLSVPAFLALCYATVLAPLQHRRFTRRVTTFVIKPINCW